ncbi:MAG: hypothetical protein QGI45_02020 [Myxococcota bacterium]|nr:hypothetical protein [Myxococcota bacterium]
MGSVIRKGILGFSLASILACGGNDVEGPERQACTVDPEIINEGAVDLKVEFDLPAALSSNCSAAQPNNLQAYILIPSAETCDLTLSGSSLSGCCPNIENASNQMLSLTLVYRDLASQKALAEQIRNQFLKTTSLRTVEVSFADEEVDTSYYGDNLTQWCAGTL